MKVTWFSISCLLTVHIASVFGGIFLKHLSEQRPPGGFLEILKKPKIPGINIQLPTGGGGGGFSFGSSLGSFGFGFGFGGQYVPPGTGVSVPTNEPHYPHVPRPPKPQVPDVPPHEPHYPHVPQPKPEVPELPPHVPDPKPQLPGGTWEEERGRPRPNWEEEYEEPKRGTYEKDNDPKHTEDRYDWDDIGEKTQEDPDSKSENFMNGDLVNGGLIQPRLKKERNKRFIESHVYHVPILFRSNAKPFQVKIRSNLNSLVKEEK